MVEVWRAAGMNLDNVEFKWAQEINVQMNIDAVMDIARKNFKSY